MSTPGPASAMRRAGAGVLMALIITSCGSSEDLSPEPEPLRPNQGSGVADDRFDGLFSVTTIQWDGQAEAPVEPIVFEVDTEFGDLAIDTACGTLLGSFSFFDDGRAGITIAGQSQKTCSANAEVQTERLLNILDRIDGWTADANNVDLLTADGDGVSLLG